MTFEDAIRRSIKSYFKGEEPTNFMKSSTKRVKYTKKYFDKMEEDEFGKVTTWDSIQGDD